MFYLLYHRTATLNDCVSPLWLMDISEGRLACCLVWAETNANVVFVMVYVQDWLVTIRFSEVVLVSALFFLFGKFQRIS